jgi:hypothetical protein
LSQIRLHWEVGLGKIHSFLQIHACGTHGDAFIVARERWVVAGGLCLVT